MPFSPLTPFPIVSPFVNAPFVKRKKGFGERLVDDISNLSLKQTLGLPLSGGLQFGAAALKGASFGLLDFGEDAQEALGELALPDTLSSAIDIAGEIGGSFVPFVASSQVAHKLFKGLSRAANLARGATTFGAPELARQALTQEFSPQAGLRSLATGAAFALPFPRLTLNPKQAFGLVPAVAATSLLFGADPLEATTAGLFAGLFGSMSRTPKGLHAEVPPKVPKVGVGEDLGKFQREFHRKAKEAGAPVSAPSHTSPGTPITQGGIPLPVPEENILTKLFNQPERVRPAQRAAAAAELSGRPQLDFNPLPGAKSQAQLLNDVVLTSSGKTQESAKALQRAVAAKATEGQLKLSLALDDAVLDAGPEAVETRILHQALAASRQEFIPRGANITNPLMKMPNARGVDMVEPGPANPFEIKADTARMLEKLESGPLNAQMKAAEIRQLLGENSDAVRRARGRGQELPPGKIAENTVKLEVMLKSPEASITNEAGAISLFREMMAQKLTPESARALADDAPQQMQKLLGPGRTSEFRRIAEERAEVLKYVFTETGAKQFRPETHRIPAELSELRRLASDHGIQVTSVGRFTTRGFAEREVIDSFQMTLAGQNVRKFKSMARGNRWLKSLEDGSVPPTNIHELRALAHPRSIDVVYNGNGTISLTNTMSGETPRAFSSLKEATEAVRQAPNIAATAAREIGPLVPKGNPPLPGTGSIGSLAAEQPPPAALACSTPASPSQSPRAKKFRVEREAKRDAATVTLKDLLGK